MKFNFLCILMVLTLGTQAQNNAQLVFQPKFRSENLILNKPYVIDGDTLHLSNFKYYITDLTYYLDGAIVYSSPKKAFLIDAADSTTFTISEKASFKFDEVKFQIGVDSLTSVSGLYEGDLDPANGMYWTWQSGYIHFKLEGTSSNCPARKNKFYWHIGGYMNPFDAQREVTIRSAENQPLLISVQVDELFREVDVSKKYQIMSPSAKAVGIADKLPGIFKTFH